jgi:hypothetical protein
VTETRHDFAQYWLGVDSPSVSSGATGFTGLGVNATFTSPQSPDGLFASSVTLGFGLESLPAAQRGPLLKQTLAHLY